MIECARSQVTGLIDAYPSFRHTVRRWYRVRSDARAMEDAGSLELAACVRAVVEGDQLTMYLTTGKKKHKRYFWVDEQSGDIMWDKRGKTLPPNKKERLIFVEDKAATVRDANWKHRDLALTIHTAGVTLIVVARDAHMKTRWIQGLMGVMRSVGEKHLLGSGGADGSRSVFR